MNPLIRNYQTSFHDKEYVANIIKGKRAQTIVNIVLQELKEIKNEEERNNVLFLIEDLYIARDKIVSKDFAASFRKAINSSKFYTYLEDNIISNQLLIDNAILSFFKYSDPLYIPILKKAYEQAKISDPFHVPSIISEINWLSHTFNWEYPKSLSKNSYYLLRWAVIGLLDMYDSITENSIDFGNKILPLYDRLRKDSYDYISQEANHKYETLKFDLNYYAHLPIDDNNNQIYAKENRCARTILNKLAPKMTFEYYRIQYGNFMYRFKSIVSSRELIERFISLSWKIKGQQALSPNFLEDFTNQMYLELQEYQKCGGLKTERQPNGA
jgi:hypothetical protein